MEPFFNNHLPRPSVGMWNSLPALKKFFKPFGPEFPTPLSRIKHAFCGGVLFVLSSCAPTFTPQKIIIIPNNSPAHHLRPIAIISKWQLNQPPDYPYLAGRQSDSLLKQSFMNSLGNSGLFSGVYQNDSAKLKNKYSTPPIYVSLEINTSFSQSFPWPWYLGNLVMPIIWPAQPRRGRMSVQMLVSIMHKETELQRIAFMESQDFNMFWYGPFRYHELVEQSTKIYQNLLSSLTQQLQAKVPVARGMRTDAMEDNTLRKPKHFAAVLQLQSLGLQESVAQSLTAKLRSELFSSGKLYLLEQHRLQIILQENGIEHQKCYARACLHKIGQLSGAEVTISGTVGRLANKFFVTLRAINVECGSMLAEVSEEYEDAELFLHQGIPAVVAKLIPHL